MENLLLKAARGGVCGEEELLVVRRHAGNDINCPMLATHLELLSTVMSDHCHGAVPSLIFDTICGHYRLPNEPACPKCAFF